MPQQQKRHYDLAIVGAGIVGLAHALIAGRRGLKTVVFERDEEPRGASALNFGMLWPIGQRPGKVLSRALRSMEIWRDLFDKAGVWNDPCGSLLLARREDELRTLQEFLEGSAEGGPVGGDGGGDGGGCEGVRRRDASARGLSRRRKAARSPG